MMSFTTFKFLFILVFLTIFNVLSGYGQQRPIVVKGVIYEDKNENGLLDKGEKRLRHITVANGRDVVTTNKKGEYLIHATSGKSVFPILPAHYYQKQSASRIANTNFFYIDPTVSQSDTITINFPLVKQEVQNQFRFGAIGDIQVGTAEELSYAANSVFSELSQRDDLSFNMILGDLVNDELTLLYPFKTFLDLLNQPSWTLPGNHDRDIEQPDHMDNAFNRHFGASTYAFYYGEALFIVLNNVYATGERSYEGRISADQLLFVKNVLAQHHHNKLLVINQHIPLVQTKNKDELIDLLADFDKTLVLSGHTHQISRHFYAGGKIQELVTGAPSGTWWRGEKDIYGVPLALLQCGSPRNYFVIDIDKSQYSIHFKGIGLDENQQMSLHIDSTNLIANIYAGSEHSTVNCRINGGVWQPMTKKRITAPEVTAIVAKNKAKIYPTEGNKTLPLRDRHSSHIWSLENVTLATGIPHMIEISAKDDYGIDIYQKIPIFLLDTQ